MKPYLSTAFEFSLVNGPLQVMAHHCLLQELNNSMPAPDLADSSGDNAALQASANSIASSSAAATLIKEAVAGGCKAMATAEIHGGRGTSVQGSEGSCEDIQMEEAGPSKAETCRDALGLLSMIVRQKSAQGV